MIEYRKGSLFDAPKGSILAHSCNCQGVWGAGIALEFADRFPGAYHNYKRECKEFGNELLGTARAFDEGGYTIVSLFVSIGYGFEKSAGYIIVNSTHEALTNMQFSVPNGSTIHMPRINSGLFKIPWAITYDILRQKPYDFVVWDPNLSI